MTEIIAIWREGARVAWTNALIVAAGALAFATGIGFLETVAATAVIRGFAMLMILGVVAFGAATIAVQGRFGPPTFRPVTDAPGDPVAFLGRLTTLAIIVAAIATTPLLAAIALDSPVGIAASTLFAYLVAYAVAAWIGLSLPAMAANADATLDAATRASKGRRWRIAGALAATHFPFALAASFAGLLGGPIGLLLSGALQGVGWSLAAAALTHFWLAARGEQAD